MDSLRRLLNRLFKRGGKKEKQEKDQTTTTPISRKPQTASRPPAAPPKDSPAQQRAVEQNEPNTTGKLPPTHPLATVQQQKPQEDTPVVASTLHNTGDDAIRPEDTLKAAKEEPESKRAVEHERNVSPAEPTQPNSVIASEPVSAITRESEHERPPAVPPKTDEATDVRPVASAPPAEPEAAAASSTAARAVEPTTNTAANAVSEPTQLASATATTERLDPVTAPKENLQPNGVAIVHNPRTLSTAAAAKPAEQPASQAPAPQSNLANDEDKIPVLSEPPPIMPIKAAPGMSATSGPLEDFPEGGPFHE